MSFLDPDLTTVAFCWKLERRDGVAIGFTSHDRDLIVDGFAYHATPGMLPSAISVSDGFDVDTLDVSGALTSDAITADDLASGRWDGARVRLFATDWRDPSQTLHLARGELGDVGVRDGAFTAELRGPTAALEAPVTEQTSPECRAELGDWRCRVDLASRTSLRRVIAVDDVVVTLDASAPADRFAFGRLRWLDGANSGLASAVLASAGATVTLREAPFFAVAAGALVELVEGCDKSFARCGSRFVNQANFRGEPHLPGNDLLTRYPGA